MFPMVSKRFSKGQKYMNVFLLSLLLTSLASFVVLIFYKFFPGVAINILYGNSFLAGDKYLIWFGLFATFYSLASLICSFYLSIGRTKVVILPVIFAIFQIVGIVLIHDSIFSIIKVSLVSATLLVISLLIYLVYETRNGKKPSFDSNTSL